MNYVLKILNYVGQLGFQWMNPSKARANELNDMFYSGHLQHERKRPDMERKYVNSDKARRKEPELITYWSGTMGGGTNIQSMQGRNRRLGLSSKIPYVGVATGLLKKKQTQLEKQAMIT